MLNSLCLMVTLTHHSTCSQSYPQKMGTMGGPFMALRLYSGVPFAVSFWIHPESNWIQWSLRVRYLNSNYIECSRKFRPW